MSLDVYIETEIDTGNVPHTAVLFTANITHNLTDMADKAGLYDYLWNPGKKNITRAEQLIKPLEKGLKILQDKPEYFKKYNPSNGWGTYDGLVRFVREYLDACKKYPKITITISK